MSNEKTIAIIDKISSELESLKAKIENMAELESLKAKIEDVVHVKDLLAQALRELEGVQRWAEPKKFDITNSHFVRATQLIELVEVYDCESVGGFGKGQLINNAEGSMYMDIYHPLFARFLWLYEKYVTKSVEGGITMIPSEIGGDLAEYWKKRNYAD